MFLNGVRHFLQLVEYISEDSKATPADLARGETRAMDCIDCHNRPTHAFELPERAVDRALVEGRISSALPFIKKKGVEVLRADYPDRATAEVRIPQNIADYYRENHPEAYRTQRTQVEAAGASLLAIYRRNIFPDLAPL